MDEDDDFFEDDEDPSWEMAGSPDSSESAMSDLLLELTINVVRLRMLMEDAEEGEFKAVFKRLSSFHAEVTKLPKEPTPREPLGFKAPSKKKSGRGLPKKK